MRPPGILRILYAWIKERGLVIPVPGETEAQTEARIRAHLNALCHEVGGGLCYFPKKLKIPERRRVRDEEILDAHARGIDRRVILRKFQISASTYYRILKSI